MMLNKKVVVATVVLALLLGAILLWGNESSFVLEVVRLILGSIFILFLPGYFLTVNFFSSEEIDWLERIALSFALSISVIPLLTFYANLIGFPISALSVYLIVCLLIGLNILYYYIAPRFIGHRVRHVKKK